MSIEVIKSELSKLKRTELLDILQFGIEIIKEKEQEDFQTPTWLKEEVLKRAKEMKSNKAETYNWDQIKNYAKSSNA